MNKQLFLVLLLSSLTSVWAGGARCSSPAAPDSDLSAVRNVPIIDSGASFSEYFSRVDREMDGQGWMFQESLCPYRAVACTQAAGQDNWIVTPRMPQVVQQTTLTSILVLVNYTTNCTNLPCDSDALELYILRTGEDSTNFASYEVVSMTIPNNVPVEVSLTGLTDSSYVLGIRDNGTCATLFRVQVYYSVCDVPFTTAGITGITTGGNTTVVNCASNSVSTSVSTSCSAEGVLSPSVPCECAAGFSGANGMTCAACISDTYKSVTGSSDCLPCPMFSDATSTSTSCSCVTGHSRADPSDITADCNTCASGYFLSGAQCLPCPAGSASPGGTQSSCTCNTGLVTAEQATNTTSDACDLCAENYFSTPCIMCPANSVRSFSGNENSCNCTEGRAVTPRGDTITTGSECSGCASTHYLSSGSCSPCPEFSTTRVVSDSTCQCQDGYAFNDGTQMSASAKCIVILGFIVNNVTRMEDSTTRPIGVLVRAGVSIDMEIVLQSTLNPNDVVVNITGNVEFNNDNEVPAPINIIGNQLALDSYPSTYTFTITDSSAYIAGGMINDTVQVYSELVLTLTDDDTVAVGFTQPTVEFNETQGKGVVTVSKMGGTSSSFTLRLTTTETNNALNVSGLIEFPASDQDAVHNFEFDIINDNSGASASRSSEFLLEFEGPPEFKDDVLFDQSDLFSTVTVIIINDDPPPTSSPLALNTIIGICVGAALVALLIFIIFILVVCICRLRSINRQGFYTTHEDQTKEPPTMLRYSASLRSISSQTVVPVENPQGTVTKENEFYV